MASLGGSRPFREDSTVMLQSGALAEVGGQELDGGHQAQMIEHGGAQLVGEIADALLHQSRAALSRRSCGPAPRAACRALPRPGSGEPQPSTGRRRRATPGRCAAPLLRASHSVCAGRYWRRQWRDASFQMATCFRQRTGRPWRWLRAASSRAGLSRSTAARAWW